jgi:hypothetical protein
MLFYFANDGASPTEELYLSIESDGSLKMQEWESAGSSTIDVTTTVNDMNWHHFAVTRASSSGIVTLFVDGVSVGTVAASRNLDITTKLWVGANGAPAWIFQGLIDDLSISKSEVGAEAVAKVHAEGRKKLGMGTPVFTRTTDDALLSNNVVDIDALDNGIWAVVFSDAATAQVFDGRIPIQEIAAPAGTVKSVALIQSPGTDSVGVAIGTTTNLKFVQPSVNLRAAMAHQYKEPIHVGESVVVDSAGIGGIFWTADDAINAAYNASKTDIFVLDGSYGPFSFLTGIADGMHLHCSGARSAPGGNRHGVEFQAWTVAAAAVTMSSNGRISNCGFWSNPSGGAGGQYAVYLSTGSYGFFDHNVIRDSDDFGIYNAMSFAKITNNHINDADGVGIYCSATSDASVYIGNTAQTIGGTYFIQILAGGNYATVVGNTGGKPVSNSGTGGATSANTEF